ncbi:MAG: class II histone deacetylase [Rhodobacter sp.]|nr:class II histone deacetylase [Rhodobacter sp.]
MRTGFYFDERCLWHHQGVPHALVMPVGGWVQPVSGAGHPESPDTKRRLKSLMDVSGLTAQLDVRSARPATRAEMDRVHEPDYLDRLKAMSDAGGGEAGFGAPFGPGSYEIAALSAGLARQAVADVLAGVHRNAYSLSRPPGHHCRPEQGMGFCLLANIPIALESARAEHGPLKVAVIDWDVHHGNGTEAVYLERADTLTISLHQSLCYPPESGLAANRGQGAGAGCNLNVELMPGMGHQTYLDAFELLVEPAVRAFAPDLIVVASGYDANAFDPLARMQAHGGTFRTMTRRVMALADALCGGKLVVVHEGGYAEAVVPFCGLAVIEELSGHRTAVEDPTLPMIESTQPDADLIAYQRARLEAQARACGFRS